MDQTTTYLEFKTDLFANTFFDVIKKYHDLEVCGYYLFLTEESLEKYGWYFKEDDY